MTDITIPAMLIIIEIFPFIRAPSQSIDADIRDAMENPSATIPET